MNIIQKSRLQISTSFISALAVVALVFIFSGCKSADNDNNNTNATNICVTNPSACNGSVYQQNNGYTGYPMGYGTNGGVLYYNNGWIQSTNPFQMGGSAAYLCNCPSGSLPTYNSYAGLGCVQSGFVASGYVALGWGPNNGQWLNIPQISNNVGYAQGGCYNGVVQSCMLNQANSCAVGSTCQPTSVGSNIGICVR